MGKELNLTGKQFDFLTVLGLHHFEYREDKNRERKVKINYWSCRCACGKEVVISTKSLTEKNRIHSCGCQISYKAKERAKEKELNYPHYKELIARWCKIKERLYNPKSISYNNYGGRGIEMCDEWKNNSFAFYEWAIKNGYKKNLQIDRIDINGSYCPENCRWVDRKTQNRNTRRNVYITYNNETRCLFEWAENLGISGKTFWKYAKNHSKDYIKTIEYYKKMKGGLNENIIKQ